MYIIENWVWLYWLGLELGWQYAASLELFHRIIDDRIEKSIKGRQIGHCAFASSIFKVQRLRQYFVLPWRTLRPPPFPTSGVHMWSVGALCVNLPSAKTFFIAAILL